MSTPNPLLKDDADALARERKRDEEVFRKRQELQQKERAGQHARAVKDQINRIQRDLDRKQADLRALQSEEPRLQNRIEDAKRIVRAGISNKVSSEERTVRELTDNLERIEQTERDLERQLEAAHRDEEHAEDELNRHKKIQRDVAYADEREHSSAEEDGRAASRRLDDQTRKAKTLEVEIHKMQIEIDSLTREIR